MLIIDGIIRDLGPQVVAASLPPHAHIIDCAGDVVAPGLIDMCAFVGEPGAEHRETIATATAAGAAGGVTTFWRGLTPIRRSTNRPWSIFSNGVPAIPASSGFCRWPL